MRHSNLFEKQFDKRLEIKKRSEKIKTQIEFQGESKNFNIKTTVVQ